MGYHWYEDLDDLWTPGPQSAIANQPTSEEDWFDTSPQPTWSQGVRQSDEDLEGGFYIPGEAMSVGAPPTPIPTATLREEQQTFRNPNIGTWPSPPGDVDPNQPVVRPDFSTKPTESWGDYQTASTTDPGKVFAGEEFYDPTTGVQQVQTARGMSSAGAGATFMDPVTGWATPTEIGWQAQEEQLGGSLFDPGLDYRRSTQAPVVDVSSEGVVQQPVIPADTTVPPVVTEDPNQKVYDQKAEVYGQDAAWIKRNIKQINALESLFLPGTPEDVRHVQNLVAMIDKSPADFPIDQKGSIDFWRASEGNTFYSKIMRDEGIKIGGTLNFGDGNNWEAVIAYMKENYPEVPLAQVMYDLSTQAQNWPRNDKEAGLLAKSVGGGPTAPEDVRKVADKPVFRDQKTTRSAWDQSVGAIQADWARGVHDVKTPDGQAKLMTALRAAYIEGLFGIGYKWEDSLVDYEFIKGRPGRTFGGLSLAQIDKSVGNWYDSIIQGKKAGEVVPSGITVDDQGRPVIPQGEPDPAAVEVDLGPIPTTVEGMAEFLGQMDQDHLRYPDFLKLYQSMIQVEASAARASAGGAGSSDALADMAVDLRAAQIKLLTLQQAAGITELQSRALQDWNKSLQEASVKAVEHRNLLEERGQAAAATGVMRVPTAFGPGEYKETVEARRLRELEAQGVQARGFEEAAIGRASEERMQASKAEVERLAAANIGKEAQLRQADQAKVQADTAKIAMENARDMAKAELTGFYGAQETLAHAELGAVQRLREAELSGRLQQWVGGTFLDPVYEGVDTIALKTFVLNDAIATRKMSLEEELGRAASTRENIRVNYESVRVQNQTYIERGQLAEAVDSRKEMNRIKEIELEDARNTMRLNTLMSLMSPVAMLMAQRMGMIPQLEAAMGIDLDLPEIPQMLPEGMTVPTAQMLNLFSPQDQQLMMAESSFRTGLSPEDLWSVIHKQRPGAAGGALRTQTGGR